MKSSTSTPKTKINYKYFYLSIYFVFYLIGFYAIEERPIDESFHLLHSSIDNWFPFNEYFIIPYFLWFAYVAVVWIFLCLKDQKAFIPFCVCMYTGMTLFLLISLVYPNYLELRVHFQTNKNVLTKFCAFLQSIDTPTNVFPSIHVFNSLIAYTGICKSEVIGKRLLVRIPALLLTIMICLSTLFLKQHSFVDFLGGFIYFFLLYFPVYEIWPRIHHKK